MSAEILIYCEVCDGAQPLLIEPMDSYGGSDDGVYGDLLCGVCKFVVATITVPAKGEYKFVKVGDLVSENK